MFVKICGIVRPIDATAAIDAGADAIGLNFVPTSSRSIDLDTARAVLAIVPDHIMTVGIFRDHSPSEVLAITSTLGLRAAQLHGDGSSKDTAAVAAGVDTVIKVVAAESPTLDSIGDHNADIVMVDAADPGGGVPFDWHLVGDLVTKHKVLLAGGLRPSNVAEAIGRVRPWGVDVATGVESEPRRKDARAIAHFVDAAASSA